MSKPKLLLADDSVTIRKVVELTFADEGVDVYTAADGETAMQKFVEVQPDIVLVDTGLPGTSGYQICEMIKQDDATRHLPVLLLVGSFEPFDQDEAERVGADGFLTKPFHSIRDLVARVWDLLGQGNPEIAGAAEPAPVAEEVVETVPVTDIDHLYQSSFSPTADLADFDPVDDIFTEAGIDDQLIEANRIGTNGAGDFDGTVEDRSQHQDTKEFDWSPESMNDPSLPQTDAGAFTEDIETPDPEVETGEEQYAGTDGSIDAGSSETIDMGLNEPMETLEPETGGSADEMSVETKEFDWSPESMVAESTSPAAVGLATESAHSAEDGADLSDRPNATTLDMSPIEDPATAGESASTVAGAASGPVDEPTPEFISLVAQRVVERLSDQVVRDIAREAVPRIAEKLIREALEEEKTS